MIHPAIGGARCSMAPPSWTSCTTWPWSGDDCMEARTPRRGSAAAQLSKKNGPPRTRAEQRPPAERAHAKGLRRHLPHLRDSLSSSEDNPREGIPRGSRRGAHRSEDRVPIPGKARPLGQPRLRPSGMPARVGRAPPREAMGLGGTPNGITLTLHGRTIEARDGATLPGATPPGKRRLANEAGQAGRATGHTGAWRTRPVTVRVHQAQDVSHGQHLHHGTWHFG